MTWLTPPQISREMHVEPAKVIGWIDAGELQATNIAQHTGAGRRRRWLIKREWLEAFLESRGNTKPATPQRQRRKERYAATYYK